MVLNLMKQKSVADDVSTLMQKTPFFLDFESNKAGDIIVTAFPMLIYIISVRSKSHTLSGGHLTKTNSFASNTAFSNIGQQTKNRFLFS